jgi:predicted secreted hydrolase
MEDGKVTHIQPTNPGRGYTSAPNVSILGIGTENATARAVHSYVTMDAAWGDPTKNMAVVALLVDQATNTEVYFDLMMSQQGPPLLVWGSGVGPILPPASGTHLQTNNYYYSLTRIDTTGSVTIGGETFAVTGRTWMDHEYGFFSTATHPAQWILQDAQLDNGWTLSNFASLKADETPKLNVPMLSFVTLQSPDGTIYFQLSKLTPVGRTWTSPLSGNTYFMEFQVEIPSFQATLHVSSLIDPQEFSASFGSSIYEGVAAATGSFAGQSVHGTAWNEQAL